MKHSFGLEYDGVIGFCDDGNELLDSVERYFLTTLPT
jgi:hypothetical protein